jgi:hypothetical protein
MKRYLSVSARKKLSIRSSCSFVSTFLSVAKPQGARVWFCSPHNIMAPVRRNAGDCGVVGAVGVVSVVGAVDVVRVMGVVDVASVVGVYLFVGRPDA